MSDLTPAAFRLRYPDFDAVSYPDPVVQSALDDAALEISAASWGSLYNRGAYALCAHLLYSANVTGAGSIGGISSRSIGDVSVTFADGSSALDDLGASVFGCEYVRLRKLISGGAVSI
jgi:hypothetical protein